MPTQGAIMRGNLNWGTMSTPTETNNGGGEQNLDLYKVSVSEGSPHESTIRFLPSPDTDFPWVKTETHFLKDDTGALYVEKCLKTIGQKCPICDSLKKLWDDERKDEYRDRKRTTYHYANILVVSDPNPELVGKVMLFKFGNQIKGLLEKQITNGKSPAVVFDYTNGYNFTLRCVKPPRKYQTYEDSSFEFQPSPLDDVSIQRVDAELKSLAELIDVNQYKSYDEIAQEYDSRTNDAPITWKRKNIAPPLGGHTPQAPSPQPQANPLSDEQPTIVGSAVDAPTVASSDFFNQMDD